MREKAMETKATMKWNQNPNDVMKRPSSSNSESMTHHEFPHSPFRLHSPLRSDHGDPDNISNYFSLEASPVKPPFDNSKALVAIDKSTQFNPNSSSFSPPPPSTPPQHSLHLTVNRVVREEGPGATTRTGISGSAGGGGAGVAAVLRRSKVHHRVIMAALGFRLSEIVLCLISFSVMAADKSQGWSGDSYDRYKEYRFFSFYLFDDLRLS
ncbi:putative EXECUTER1 protein, chloroplast precursor [Hibiscus syriacus]|uniref:CASP-like protein n=1 Tax=Hibiscus syriacus TaxID=106335 RepID=A0A6A3CBR2_HIBSY|nr:putative EXECUTER1 protein, chloroplast precursor [Hibiscus syriacus]